MKLRARWIHRVIAILSNVTESCGGRWKPSAILFGMGRVEGDRFLISAMDVQLMGEPEWSLSLHAFSINCDPIDGSLWDGGQVNL